MLRLLLARGLLAALVVAAGFGALRLREATSPGADGYWAAMVAAPDGVYLADEPRGELVKISADGSSQRLGRLPWQVPGAIVRALSVNGQEALLGTDSGLFVSHDLGRSWRFAIPGRHITAVGQSPAGFIAGAWNDALYLSRDNGAGWQAAQIPPGDTQFVDADCCWIATLLGVLASDDGGLSWHRLGGLPTRITAVSDGRVADWAGDVFALSQNAWVRVAQLPAGIRSIAGGVAGTTNGIYFDGRSIAGPIGGREVTRVVASGGVYYAAAARGGIYSSPDGIGWRFLYQP